MSCADVEVSPRKRGELKGADLLAEANYVEVSPRKRGELKARRTDSRRCGVFFV